MERAIASVLAVVVLPAALEACAAVGPGRWPLTSVRVRNAGSRDLLVQVARPERAQEFECEAVVAGEAVSGARLRAESITIFAGQYVVIDSPVGDGTCGLVVVAFEGRTHAIAWRRGTPPGRPIGEDPGELRIYPTGDILAGRALRVVDVD